MKNEETIKTLEIIKRCQDQVEKLRNDLMIIKESIKKKRELHGNSQD